MKISIADIEVLLRNEDIEGFIGFGAPTDEYFSEAEQIVAAVSELSREQFKAENIAAIISLVWMRSFDLSEEDMKLRMPSIWRAAESVEKLFV